MNAGSFANSIWESKTKRAGDGPRYNPGERSEQGNPRMFVRRTKHKYLQFI